MTLLQLAVLSLGGLVIGVLEKNSFRKRVIMIASILAIYWLQPAISIRYMEFWLPTILISLVVVVFSAIFPDRLIHKENLVDLSFVLGVVVFVGGMRYFGPVCCLTSTTPPRFVSILLFILVLALLVGLLSRFKPSKFYLSFSFFAILALFLILKNNALAELASKLLRTATGQNPALATSSELIWLGYSYAAFRLLHILRDKQTGRLPDMSVAELFSYVIFFPSFAAGPIDRTQRFVKELNENKVLNSERFVCGAERLAVGMFKKFVLADSLALISLSQQNADQITQTFWGWVILYAYAFRILLDFSGYTDIAIGIGIFAGLQLPENFRKPYLQGNLTEFWNNWHMTLTQWFRAYFFNPLTRQLRSNKTLPPSVIIFVSQLLTMIVIGLWHGISWNFVIWGAWHGIGLFVHNRWSDLVKRSSNTFFQKGSQNRWPKILGVVVTFNYVALGWIWFVLPSPQLGWSYLGMLFGGF